MDRASTSARLRRQLAGAKLSTFTGIDRGSGVNLPALTRQLTSNKVSTLAEVSTFAGIEAVNLLARTRQLTSDKALTFAEVSRFAGIDALSIQPWLSSGVPKTEAFEQVRF